MMDRTYRPCQPAFQLAFVLMLCLFTLHAAGQEKPTPAEIIAKVRPQHPRLLATADDFAAIKSRLDDPNVAPVFARIKANADAMLARPVCKHELRDGVRLLYVSREVRDLVLTLGLMYRLTGEAKYADRLWAEVDAASRFPDWNPKHFLDTAEMTCAVAIAYDWLHEHWSEDQRQQLRDAIVRLGLKPALANYNLKTGSFSIRENNWNQVCNGGILAGALAVAQHEPELAGDILARAIATLPIAMKKFAPDGAWGEGPGYWSYATEYNCIALDALRSACGTDFGLSEMQGFSVTGDMPLAFTGPLGLTFNYADAGPGFGGASQLFWFATTFDTPAYAAFQIPYAKAHPRPFDLLWGSAWLAQQPAATGRPLDLLFRKSNIVYLRSAWGDPQALFVAFKGGDNRTSHAQLDLGSFVFDALGQRWAIDVGPDDYNRPGYFSKPSRWTFYRCRAEGNNTLVINPGAEPDQSVTAAAEVTQFHSDADRGGAVVDLTSAYAGHGTKSVRRGFALLDARKRLLIQDEIRAADKPVDYRWFMHTDATIEIAPDGSTATLKKGGETLTARIASPAGAKFTVMEAKSLPTSPPEPGPSTRPVLNFQNRLASIRKLTVHLENVTDTTIAVTLTAGVEDGQGSSIPIKPLGEWPAATENSK